jgi:hypothetical protein
VEQSLIKLLATITKHSSDRGPWSKKLPNEQKFKPVRLLLSLDESRDLLDTRTHDLETKNEQPSAYQLLCKAFGACINQDLLVVYLSTNLSLSQYSPYHEKIWSYRSSAGVLRPDDMQAPIVELPFDTFAKVKEDDVKLEQVSEPAFMVQFGRPL